MTPFNHNHLLKRPFSQYSHILRYQGPGFNMRTGIHNSADGDSAFCRGRESDKWLSLFALHSAWEFLTFRLPQPCRAGRREGEGCGEERKMHEDMDIFFFWSSLKSSLRKSLIDLTSAPLCVRSCCCPRARPPL